MFDRMMPSFVFRAGFTSLVILVSACVTTPQTKESESGATPDRGIDDYVLVDCKLPGQVRQLGTKMTYLAPRRPIKTTKRDCAIRGGEFVLFDRSDYSSALASLLPKARGGDPIAQTYVGEIYEKGLGLSAPDYNSAASWYRKAAEGNHAPAQTSLGSLYERGLGVPKDKARALDWYRKASGLTEDRLVFESALKAERERFRRELSVRNRTAESLQRKLHQTKQKLDRQSSEAKGPRGALKTDLRRSADTARTEQGTTAREAERNALQAQYDKERQLLESQRRDAASEAERLKKELEAVRALQASRGAQSGSPAEKAKAAQLGKLELTRNEQYRAVLDMTRRLAGSP